MPTIDVNELFAQYGQAMYYAQCLELEMSKTLVLLDLYPKHKGKVIATETAYRLFDDYFQKKQRQTMGQRRAGIEQVINDDPVLNQLLHDAVNKRNWLSHDFFREHANAFFDQQEYDNCLRCLYQSSLLFYRTDRLLSQITKPNCEAIGMSRKQILESSQELFGRQVDPDGNHGPVPPPGI